MIFKLRNWMRTSQHKKRCMNLIQIDKWKNYSKSVRGKSSNGWKRMKVGCKNMMNWFRGRNNKWGCIRPRKKGRYKILRRVRVDRWHNSSNKQ